MFHWKVTYYSVYFYHNFYILIGKLNCDLYMCMYVYICVCMCIYVYICVYMCMYVYICVCMCIYEYICVYMCIYVYICVYVCMYVYVCVCMCIYVLEVLILSVFTTFRWDFRTFPTVCFFVFHFIMIKENSLKHGNIKYHTCFTLIYFMWCMQKFVQ